MSTLLVIGYVWPEPKSSAAGSRMLSLLRLFKHQSWRVIFATPAQKTDFNHDLRSENIEEKVINLNDSAFDHYIAELAPSAVLFDRFMMEEQFGWRVAENCPNAIRILDTEDLQCLRDARHTAVKQNREFCNDDLQTDLAKREVASIYRCDLSLIISKFEATLLTDYFNVNIELLIHIPFLIDNGEIDRKPVMFAERSHFVTIGNLRHAPNWDSVLYLREIWPQIRQQLPSAELHIYGAYTPPKATALNSPNDGFLIKDRAANVKDVMRQARVCLSPLRFGAGIKGKFIDAMLTATPSVTTAIGAEGMARENGWPGIVEDEPQKIVDAAVMLYQNESLWTEASQKCKDLLSKHYCSQKIGTQLLQRVNDLINNLPSHRRKNFIGSMLNFHTMRSTKYMSKWIEEKNK